LADVEQAVTFIAADGTAHPLMADDLEVEFGLEGRFMPPVESVIEQVPGQPGGRRRQTTFGVREVVVPLEVLSASQAALRVRLRELVRAFDPTRGDALLRTTAPDGAVRQIGCRYASGMELVEDRDLIGNVQRAAVVFTATDPFWYDTDPLTSTFTTGAAPNFLGSPFLPIRLSSDRILGEQTVRNDGDVETWPVWTVHGPATSILLRNVTTGQVIDLPIALTATQSVVIDTRPFRKTVRRDDGTNLYGSLTATSALWALGQGATVIRTEVPGSTTDTFVSLVFARRWLSP
jgi:hypothetical protein